MAKTSKKFTKMAAKFGSKKGKRAPAPKGKAKRNPFSNDGEFPNA